MYPVGGGRLTVDRPEPIEWRQLVYGPDGLATLPRRPGVGRIAPEDMDRLRGMQKPTALVRTSNLELVQTENAGVLRTSSPLNQRAPVEAWLSPIHNYSDVSTVSHRERSLPSTILTSIPSGLEASFEPKSNRASHFDSRAYSARPGQRRGPAGVQSFQRSSGHSPATE